LYAAHHERGSGEQKRDWGIKMKNARELNFKTYEIIDTLDTDISDANIGYRQVLEVLACSHEPSKGKGLVGSHI
jgi:hypothetical protein